MMVMMMAITPSLKASSLDLVIADLSLTGGRRARATGRSLWPAPDNGRILRASPQFPEATILFKKILIAVDSEPVAAHAADIGGELARLAGAEVAFVHVIDPELVNAAD